VQLAEQPFQNGHMIWRSDTHEILVFLRDAGATPGLERSGHRRVVRDTFQDDDQEPPTGPTPPEGTQAPLRAFGKVWREQEAVRWHLGGAIQPERDFVGAVQRFAGGTTVWTPETPGPDPAGPAATPRTVWVWFGTGEDVQALDRD
jgi:hypothetical protein